MQATLPLRENTISSGITQTRTSPPASANNTTDEINSYIGVRDLLLGVAEEVTTEINLHRAWMANEYAEKCLRPARSPYQAQCLPEADASRERQRCRAVKMRLAELRTHVGIRHCHAA